VPTLEQTPCHFLSAQLAVILPSKQAEGSYTERAHEKTTACVQRANADLKVSGVRAQMEKIPSRTNLDWNTRFTLCLSVLFGSKLADPSKAEIFSIMYILNKKKSSPGAAFRSYCQTSCKQHLLRIVIQHRRATLGIIASAEFLPPTAFNHPKQKSYASV